MYGNTYLDLEEYQIGLYGNTRYTTLNLITANKETFEEYFHDAITDINYTKKQLVENFVAVDRQVDLNLNVLYEKLGLYQNSQPVIPVFKATDLSILSEISELNFNDVVKLTFFLTDISQMAIVRDIRDQYIDTKNPPASSAVEVNKLINDKLLIEIEAIAVAN
ncbi:RidA family protein [Bacillus cereus]|uniref:RidA family protein n=1 Tax=Bacillus cereus TaxID=1396 RepID=UPI0033650AAB